MRARYGPVIPPPRRDKHDAVTANMARNMDYDYWKMYSALLHNVADERNASFSLQVAAKCQHRHSERPFGDFSELFDLRASFSLNLTTASRQKYLGISKRCCFERTRGHF